jgi:hypothetical protein
MCVSTKIPCVTLEGHDDEIKRQPGSFQIWISFADENKKPSGWAVVAPNSLNADLM